MSETYRDSMWNIVSSLQSTLDEAAGIHDPQVVVQAHSEQNREQTCKELQEKIEKLQLEGASLSADLGAEKERSKMLLSEKRKCESLISELNDRCAAMESKLKATQDSFDERILVEQRQKIEVDDLRQKLSDTIDSLTRSERDLAITISKNEELKQQLLLRVDNEIYESECRKSSSLLEETFRQKSQIDHLQNEVARKNSKCEEQLFRLEREFVASQQRAHQAEAKNIDVTLARDAELKQVALQIELQGTENQKQKEQIVVLKQQLHSSSAAIGPLQSRLREVEERTSREIEMLTAKVRRAETYAHDAEAQIKACQLSESGVREMYDDLLQKFEVVSRSLKVVNPGECAPSADNEEQRAARACSSVPKRDSAQDFHTKYSLLEQKHVKLAQQHDLLLQMYGQLAEQKNS